MRQEAAQRLVMLLLPAAAAYLIAVNKAVVGHIGFIPAVAQAVPDDSALIITLIRGRLGSQAAKAPASDVRCGIAFYAFAAAVRPAAGHELGGCRFAGVAAGAQASPIWSHFRALPAPADNAEVAEGLAKQVIGSGLMRHFFAQTATALRLAVAQGTLQHIALGAAVAAAQIFPFSPRGGHTPAKHCPAPEFPAALQRGFRMLCTRCHISESSSSTRSQKTVTRVLPPLVQV